MEKNNHLHKKEVLASQFVKEETYWMNLFSGEITKSSFPHDFEKNKKKEQDNGTGKRKFAFKLSDELFSKLMKLSNGSDARLHIILTSGLAILLHKVTGNKDIIIGTPILKQKSHLNFINTILALRNTVEDNMTFKEFLLEVRKTTIEAIENQNYPLETLPYRLDMPFSHKDVFPFFDTALLVKNIHDKKYMEHINLNMIFSFQRTEECIEGEVEFNASLYNEAGVERIIGYYRQIFETALNNIDTPIALVEILTEQERRQVLFGFNHTRQAYPKDKTIHELFEQQAVRTPDNIAIVGLTYSAPPAAQNQEGDAGERLLASISFGELNQKSNQLARLLQSKGAAPGTFVGVMVENSIDMVIAMLGTIKAGGAYLPIDPNYPQERIQLMLKDSRVHILVAGRDMVKNAQQIGVIEPWTESLHQYSGANLETKTNAEGLFYIIYTSGSVGVPKGVLVRHRGFINLVNFHRNLFEEDCHSRMSQVANLSFDAMAFEVWPSLLSGAALYIVNPEIRMDPGRMKEWLIEKRITISFQPTVIAELLLEEEWPESDTALKALRTAGDKLKKYPTRQYPFNLYNLYGPTEDTVWTTWAQLEINIDSERTPHIGRPIANHQVYIVGGNLNPQPIGVPGELCIGGDGLAVGYLNRPELTAEKFCLRRPGALFEKTAPVRETSTKNFLLEGIRRLAPLLYRTGDLTLWLPNGNIRFLGRVDHQVKIRGYRIELGEIENQLTNHHNIKEAVVIARQDKTGQKYLCAYIVFDDAANEIPGNETIKEFLANHLPTYMIPPYFVRLKEIPLTPNGKIDRKSLPEPEITASEKYIAPGNEVERKLVNIWAEVLNIHNQVIGVQSNFFELGGYSLKATVLTSKIYRELNVKIPLMEIFKNPTIQYMARYIQETGKNDNKITDENLVVLRKGLSKTDYIFFIHDGTGEVEAYIGLCHYLDNNFNCWGIRVDRRKNIAPQKVSIIDIAGEYARKIKKVQSQGPYNIAGWSLGGIIAYEIVRQLETLHEPIGFFAMFDTYTYRTNLPGPVNGFSVNDELKFLQNVLKNEAVIEKWAQKMDTGEIWNQVVDYLEAHSTRMEEMDNLIAKNNIRKSLPNFDQLNIKEKIFYINILRSFQQAWLHYMPVGKINSPIHFFKAHDIKQKASPIQVPFNESSTETIITHEVSGDHFSMLAPPEVINLAKAFERAMNLELNTEMVASGNHAEINVDNRGKFI
jgi:amino acid adenylation domain-containing protein